MSVRARGIARRAGGLAWIAGLVLALMLGGCGAARPVTSLSGLADRLDPGDVPPLFTDLPEALRAAVEQSSIPLGELDPLRERPDIVVDPTRALFWAAGAELSDDPERDVSRLLTLAWLYAVVAQTGEQGFPALWRGVEETVSQDGADDTTADVAELRLGLERAFARAGPRLRWAVVRIVRQTSDRAILREALRILAAVERTDERFAAEREALGAIVELDQATPDDRRDLARACYATLDRECGDRELAALRAMPGTAAEIARVETAREALHDLQRLGDASDVESELRRAAALERLSRTGDALALYEALVDRGIRDARPYARLARLRAERARMAVLDLGSSTMERIADDLRAARELPHRDRTYYGMAVLVWQLELMRAATEGAMAASGDPDRPALSDAAAARLASDAAFVSRGLGELDRALAECFALHAETVLDQLRGPRESTAAFARWVPDAARLRATYPDDPRVDRLGLFFAGFAERGVAEELLAGGSPENAELRRRARYRAAVVLDDPALLPTDDPGGELALLKAAFRLPRSSRVWATIERSYRALLASASDRDRPRMRNNLAVALHRLGRHDEAQQAWEPLPEWEAFYNRTASATERGDAWAARVQEIVDGAPRDSLRCQAARLLASVRRPVTVADDPCAATARSGAASGEAGVVGDFSITIGFRYDSDDTIALEIEVGADGWLILSPSDAAGDPDADRDGDRIVDRCDVCPDLPETYQGMADEDGCPDVPPDFHGPSPARRSLPRPAGCMQLRPRAYQEDRERNR